MLYGVLTGRCWYTRIRASRRGCARASRWPSFTTMDGTIRRAPHYQGYVDERSIAHVKGWLRDVNDEAVRLDYEVVLPGRFSERVLARGKANAHSDVLVQVGVGDGNYAFEAKLAPPVSEAERERIFVRPRGAKHKLELAPALRTDPPGNGPYQGFVDECSSRHISGWVRDLSDAAQRVTIEVILPTPNGEILLKRQPASQFNDVVRQIGVGDGTYAFFILFERELSAAERDAVFVRVQNSSHQLPLAPAINREFQPIHHVAMDIVNNCNLRCPFCVYDYSQTSKTYLMTDETFESALRLIPYVTDGNFWLSCLHEATLHPRLAEFIQRVPDQYRKKLFFTTNLAKRQQRHFFEMLAASGMDHVNISLESLQKDVYEKMRKGARQPIFQENWDLLLDVFANTQKPPLLRYNLMAYRSNLQEIPGLVEILLNQKQGFQVEIRSTMDMPQIPDEFREEEFLSTAEWSWLTAELKKFPPERIVLLLPPEGKGYDREDGKRVLQPSTLPPEQAGWVEAKGRPAPRPFNVRIAWDGTLNIYSELPTRPGEQPDLANYLISNINELEDPLATFFALA